LNPTLDEFFAVNVGDVKRRWHGVCALVTMGVESGFLDHDAAYDVAKGVVRAVETGLVWDEVEPKLDGLEDTEVAQLIVKMVDEGVRQEDVPRWLNANVGDPRMGDLFDRFEYMP
jgi:hypothetical protein